MGDLHSGSMGDGTCIPASGSTWGGKSFSGGGSTPFETCYRDATGRECWSKSYYVWGDWKECRPNGYTGNDQGWNFLNSGAAAPGCGSPCQQFSSDDDPVNRAKSAREERIKPIGFLGQH